MQRGSFLGDASSLNINISQIQCPNQRAESSMQRITVLENELGALYFFVTASQVMVKYKADHLVAGTD